MRTTRLSMTGMACVAAVGAAFLGMGCDLDPVQFLSRNACEILNCDVLFFVDDLLPLSAAPAASGGGAAAPAAPAASGHVH